MPASEGKNEEELEHEANRDTPEEAFGEIISPLWFASTKKRNRHHKEEHKCSASEDENRV